MPPTEESGCQSEEADEAFFGFFKTHEEFAEAVQPGVSAFDYPAPCLEIRLGAFGFGLFAALFDVRTIAARLDLLEGRLAFVAGIRAQILDGLLRGLRPRDDDGIKRRGQQLDVMHVGPADDERERDPTAVHQQAALATFFFPDPLDCGPRIPRPEAL